MDSEEEDAIIALLLLRRRSRKKKRKEREWEVHPIISHRIEQGAYDNIVANMRDYPDKFKNFHRLSVNQFDCLLGKISQLISKMNYRKEPLSPGLRFSVTLRYLSAGDLMISLSYLYHIGHSTICEIIKETTGAIWQCLQPEVLPFPNEEDWKRISLDFFRIWDFPNCVGAIDGKHVVCQAFPKTGSNFFNYKGTFSVVLLGICDADYRFVYVSIGSSGRESDGGIFQASDFGQALERNQIPFSPMMIIPEGSQKRLPPVIVGDAAFPLKQNLMRPYPGQNLSAEQTIFNYRLSRARRTIENTFGVMAARFRIFRKPIPALRPTVNNMVKCCVVLHNWLRTCEMEMEPGDRDYMPGSFTDTEVDGVWQNGGWRAEGDPEGLIPIPVNQARNSTGRAKAVRDDFARYFMKEGAIYWQWMKLPAYERDYYEELSHQP